MLECFSIKSPKEKKENPGKADLHGVQVCDLGSRSGLVGWAFQMFLNSAEVVMQSVRNKENSNWPLESREIEKHSVQKNAIREGSMEKKNDGILLQD